MLYRRGLAISVLVACAGTLCLTNVLPAAAKRQSQPVELMKYFNPVQKKGYRNESQDRVIKKKSYKAGDQTAGELALAKDAGFFAVVPADKTTDRAYLDTLLNADTLRGISVVLPWQAMEPKEDEYNWQPIDTLLQACKEHNKTLILRVATCGLDLPGSNVDSDTPAWVFEQGAKSLAYQGDKAQQRKLPLFWDTTYLAAWADFVKDMAERYDGNPALHSIGITGGGVLGGTSIVPGQPPVVADGAKAAGKNVWLDIYKKEHGMTQRQVADHWKYVVDVFPKRFKQTPMNFALNPPLPGRMGEDTLDMIGDYVVFRYGQRVYLTRQNVASDKHGFDDYRLLIKYRNDTYTGMQLTSAVKADHMEKLVKTALDDGISFVELPAEMALSDQDNIKTPLAQLRSHLGYQLVAQKIALPESVPSGQAIKAAFAFTNIGDATAKRPAREIDKDVPDSYKVQLELRDASGKAIVQLLHTPDVPTNMWLSGQPIVWERELKTTDAAKLPLGQYTAWLSLIDPETKAKILFLNGTGEGTPTAADTIPVGNIAITAPQASSAVNQAEPGKKSADQTEATKPEATKSEAAKPESSKSKAKSAERSKSQANKAASKKVASKPKSH